MFTRLLILGIMLVAAPALAASGDLMPRQWNVDGVTRRALVHVPPGGGKDAPLVFVFHGHGGTSLKAARMFRMHETWPEAVVVYMQGLPSSVPGLDPEGKGPGWQVKPGQQGDRDLRFFDIVLKDIRDQFHTDDRKVFCTGFSQGGMFTYLLWAERGGALAAVAAGGAVASPANVERFKPKPVLHVAGTRDRIMPFPRQKASIENLIRVNRCDRTGQKLSENLTRYADADNRFPVLTFIHSGGHELPPEAAAAIANFFRRCAERTATQASEP